ncbi:hypothetical protein [Mycobacteroides abscessus]|uniref:hypothetical protein n=1 Tax=Mycobacteroides abscessus TaxID=36809 RepID=UPI000385C475|nr:hypothetical protein [Mycobacteroides abscessus]EPZ18783.1 hypothetical protein M879_19445 [Mycobacteroides abscessus V06705]MDO3268000.1 hypothetical protein [Mycobacteroides abscessus subsp. abscessus]
MALNTETARMNSAAAQLEGIKQEVLAGLGQYVSRNQNLTGGGFAGTAATTSLTTTEDVANTGRQVSERFQMVIDQMRKGAHHYDQVNDQNRAALANVANPS